MAKMKLVMLLFGLIFVFCGTTYALLGQSQKYDGFQVWRVVPSNADQIKSLIQLGKSFDGFDLLDFWREATPHSLHQPVDIMVPPGLRDNLHDVLATLDLDVTVTIPDVGGLVSSQMAGIQAKRANEAITTSTLADFDYARYHTYDEIQQWVFDIVDEYKDITSQFLLTHSFEGRPVYGFKIRGRNSDASVKPPPAVWFQGGIHSREWISPATVMWFTAQLLKDYENGDALAMDMFDNMDWYITPSLNPDGYVFTWTEDRLWRKTRSDNFDGTNSGCKGADPNRNFPFGWGGNGTSPFLCSNIYHGPSPLSEIEVEGLVDYLRDLKASGQDFHVFMDWHSYGQYFLSPWSYSAYAPNPPDYDDMKLMGAAAEAAIFAVHGTVFQTGSSIDLLSEAAGSSKDWGYVPYDATSKLKGGLGAKYSYTVELRDKGQYGFLLPEDQIQPVGEEMYAGVRAIGDYILKELGFIN